MNQNPTPRWSPLVSGPEDDFTNFLDFSDLNFSAFGDGSVGGGTPQASGAGDGDAGVMDLVSEGAGIPVAGMMSHAGIQRNAMAHSINGFQESLPDMTSSADFLIHQQHRRQQQQQQHHQQQQQQHQSHLQLQQQPRYYGHDTVPPTPNSLEMHGGHSEYYNPTDRQQQLMYEHYRRHQIDQVRRGSTGTPSANDMR